MKTITFPEVEYLVNEPVVFCIENVVLVGLGNFIKKVFFSILFSPDVGFSQKSLYRYYFTKFEINSLSSFNEGELGEILCDYFYCVPYNFYIDSLKARLSGVLDIKLNFVNNSVFEKSYFEVDFNLGSESDLKRLFENLSTDVLYGAFCDFQNALWGRVFAKIKKSEIKKGQDFEYDADFISFLPLFTTPFCYASSHNLSLNSSLPDTYHVICDLFLNNRGKKNYMLLSPDDILNYRNLKKNPNSKKYRGGYKLNQRSKIIDDIRLLSSFGAIYSISISDDMFCISLNFADSYIYSVPRKILEYSQKSQLSEKFIGEFLCFELSKGFKECIVVQAKDLTDIVAGNLNTDRLSLLRDRVEKVLDTLQEDKIISKWVYKSIDEDKIKHLSDYEKLKVKVTF